jgi:glucose-6-phosphate 1-dehydrogenase
MDAIGGEQTSFTTGAEVLATWRLLEPVLHSWEQGDEDLETYKFGSAGPDIEELK